MAFTSRFGWVGCFFLLSVPIVLADDSGPTTRLREVKFPHGTCDLYLLAQQGVQKDLQLTETQIKSIRDAVAELIEKKSTLSFHAQIDLLRKHQTAIRERLTQPQRERLQQITYQYKASVSLWAVEVIRDLKITGEQLQKMESISYGKPAPEGQKAELLAVSKQFGDYPKRDEEAWKLREWQILACLTDKQRTQWKEMLGTPFTGAIPSPIYIEDRPAVKTLPKSDSTPNSVQELKTEAKRLQDQLDQLKKRIIELEDLSKR